MTPEFDHTKTTVSEVLGVDSRWYRHMLTIADTTFDERFCEDRLPFTSEYIEKVWKEAKPKTEGELYVMAAEVTGRFWQDSRLTFDHKSTSLDESVGIDPDRGQEIVRIVADAMREDVMREAGDMPSHVLERVMEHINLGDKREVLMGAYLVAHNFWVYNLSDPKDWQAIYDSEEDPDARQLDFTSLDDDSIPF